MNSNSEPWSCAWSRRDSPGNGAWRPVRGREGQGIKGTGTSTSPFCGSGKSPTWSYPRVLGRWVPTPCYKFHMPPMGAEPGRSETTAVGTRTHSWCQQWDALGGSVWGCRPGHEKLCSGFSTPAIGLIHFLSPCSTSEAPSLWPVSWGWECNLSLQTCGWPGNIIFSKLVREISQYSCTCRSNENPTRQK